MLEALFTFRGRINRLQFLGMTLGVGFVMTVAVMTTAFALVAHHAAAAGGGAKPPLGLLFGLALLFMPPFFWVSFSLQACRLRDIGWKPLYVLPAWVGLSIVDSLVAVFAPALAMDHGHTAVGVVANLVLVGCLLFWPGKIDGGDDLDPRIFETGWTTPDKLAPAISAKPAKPVWAAAPGPPSGFGRRGG